MVYSIQAVVSLLEPDLRMKKTALALLVSLPVFFLSASTASAQTRLIPRAGLYASLSDLGTVETAEGIRKVGEQETSLALGVTVELGSARSVGLRVSGLYGTKAEVPVGGIGCEGSACDLRRTLLAISGSVVMKPFPGGSNFGPYLLVGGGMKRYDFEFESGSQLKDAFGDESKASWVLGAGFEWNLGLLKGNLELVDYIGDSVLADGDRQHDLFLTVGLVLG